MTTAYDFSATTIDGSVQKLSEVQGQTLLVVSMASSAFTRRYTGWKPVPQVQDRGSGRTGLSLRPVWPPEPGDEAEIKNFCSLSPT